jgi:hypothetical protein
MAWAITLEISDCAVPTFKIEGASISDGTILGSGLTDANGQLIYGIADDTILQYIVRISHTGTTVHAAHGYITKNFTLNKSSAGTIQMVCLNPAPDTTPGTGGGGTGGGCFIVSATTGSSESAEVSDLRQLRNRVASVSRLGAELIDVIYRDYYRFSPAIAAELEQDTIARMATLEVVVRPLLAWYSLAGILALEQVDEKAVKQAAQEVLNACPQYLGGSSIIDLLEAIRGGEALPANTHPLLLDFAPRIQEATRLRFASWAIFDPLVRVWRSAKDNRDVVDEVGQWLATAPLEALAPPSDPQMLDAEFGALAGFFDFRPTARWQLGKRLVAAWPDATSALERAGFVSQTPAKKQE